jgi:hypothetical protein
MSSDITPLFLTQSVKPSQAERSVFDSRQEQYFSLLHSVELASYRTGAEWCYPRRREAEA